MHLISVNVGQERSIQIGKQADMTGIYKVPAPGAVTITAGGVTGEVFAPLPAPLLDLHRAVKRVFDPAGTLNPGRMYADL